MRWEHQQDVEIAFSPPTQPPHQISALTLKFRSIREEEGGGKWEGGGEGADLSLKLVFCGKLPTGCKIACGQIDRATSDWRRKTARRKEMASGVRHSLAANAESPNRVPISRYGLAEAKKIKKKRVVGNNVFFLFRQGSGDRVLGCFRWDNE